ncbi:hypothetical protein A0O34_12010 [Chryseobacterium glaciei]|uniref:Permuted papain-like amidase enzyme, YaeF/YiiX, C92 family n=1 Tax=Chryseobacterium glaciei TaxID=1685010 RepID=A0A172XW19_9FLAO|nr:YiiX/YebB-like N1pC/P60 family cysteine hydrolase [Chryseobacterium glaciei]ANF51197.1 hypothetical protein A0O34_12010 [Chryseobacterium glaciei]
MKYILPVPELQIGDILMVNRNDTTASRIREKTNSNYSHVLIYRGDNCFLESDGLGVTSVNPCRLLFEKFEDACVLRLKDISELSKLAQSIGNAANKIGTSYASPKEVLRGINCEDEEVVANQPNRQFCTRFVAQIYKVAGLPIVKNADYCSPKDFEDSSMLFNLNISLLEASQKQIDFANEKNPPIQLSNDATYNFFEGVRAIVSEDIQTFPQAEEFLLSNPQFDEQITTILETTDYLWVGDFERELNSHLYDFDSFIQYYGFEDALNYAISDLQNEINRTFNFRNSIDKYKKLYDETSLKYFDVHYKCYQRQLQFSQERFTVFSQVIMSRHDYGY